METIRFTERRKSTKLPAIIIGSFLVIGGCFVAYAIKNENNPRMLGFSKDFATTESNAIENVEMTDAQKLEQAMNLNFEVKEISSSDSSSKKFIGNIHLPAIYVDGKELAELNAKIQSEYITRFNTLKEQMQKAESNYSFNVTYTYYENIVGLKKVVSLVLTQQIVDSDSNKVTSQKITTYNIDLASKTSLAQSDVVMDTLGKDYKTLIKNQVKDYVIDKKYVSASAYNYEPTGLENFYIQDSKFHIVFNGDSDSIISTNDVLDIEIERAEEDN